MQTITTGTTTQHDGYTITQMGTVKLGRSTFKVQEQHIEATGTRELQLIGARGAFYCLTPTRRPGVYTPVSLFSGPMRKGGNPVRVTVMGDIIELAE